MIEPIRIHWKQTIAAPIDEVWAAFSDTERINRLGGLHMQFSLLARGDGRSPRTGELRHLGMRVTWKEKPVTFTAPNHCCIDRVYDAGPISRSQTELWLQPNPAGGTDFTYEGRFTPKSRLFSPAIRLDVEMTVRPKLDRAFKALIAALEHNAALPDAPPPKLSSEAEKRLQRGMAKIVEPGVAEHLGEFLRTAPIPEQVRMQPLLLAKRWKLPEKDVVAGLLRAVSAGLLQARWDVICPSCKLPAASAKTLDLQRGKSHCGACEVQYDASLADSVALSLRPVAEIRAQPERIDCLSSPGRMPHVVSQKVVAPRQEVEWPLTLLSGNYHIRGWPNLDQVVVTVRSELARSEGNVLAGPKALTPPTLRLRAGRVTLRVRSKIDEPLKLVIERVMIAPNTLTVGRILEWPDVAALLPADSLEPGLRIEPFSGPLLAIQVCRGGERADSVVGQIVRAAGANACQVSNGWVLATMPSWRAVHTVADQLQGALWQTAAVGIGTVVQLHSGDTAMASGAALQELVALAQSAEPGQWLVEGGDRLTEAMRLVGALVQVPATGGPAQLTLNEREGPPLALPTRVLTAAQSGDLIDDRFELGQLVGKGGFGLVYAALDKVTSTQVVVKLMRPELADDAIQVQRFFDEGRLAARLEGPNNVQVYEWGIADDGRLFLAMEQLIGRELGEVLRDLGTVDPVRTLKLCAGALAGLHQAHNQGLVHRDIKPANLYLVHEGTDDETLKVIDFGIALDLTGRIKAPEQAGAIIGTPIYMSPEQVRGEPLDCRTDLYALGIVLYECLSGALPFAGPTMMALLLARLTQHPIPLTRNCAQPLPNGVAQLVDQALSHDVEERPTDAEAMRQLLLTLAVQAGDPAQWSRSWREHKSAATRLHDAMTAATVSDLFVDETPSEPMQKTD
ncbi:MAG: hypothetical protein EXR77_05170 [Myxococcales bacterium]|nr:hypothetical protein [Myxococcales bacterium]